METALEPDPFSSSSFSGCLPNNVLDKYLLVVFNEPWLDEDSNSFKGCERVPV
jgi:hypothetical protein